MEVGKKLENYTNKTQKNNWLKAMEAGKKLKDYTKKI